MEAAPACRPRASSQPTALTSPALTEFMRCGAGLLSEEAREMRRVGKGQIISDLMDRLGGEYQLTLGFGQHALADQVARRHAGRALDVVVEPVGRHRELLGIEVQ